ncbi:DEAD/DEAH box helicase family protein [Xenorhabdus nematophila]|uniref:DEAD/DEAH box helicase family protein n=1 Tax=Xenorhabdus nematophila TaxID=628 RepID=UPI0022772E5E|nr:DEAD/DEAH box helicase family protein [Xenorhabdus nematophila]
MKTVSTIKKNKQKGQLTYKERLKPLRDKRIVFIFDECHRSQFGDNHQAIKEFFPNAQLFGFTGTPIFPQNAIYKKSRWHPSILQNYGRYFPKKNFIPIPLPTLLMTEMCYVSTLIISNLKARSNLKLVIAAHNEQSSVQS